MKIIVKEKESLLFILVFLIVVSFIVSGCGSSGGGGGSSSGTTSASINLNVPSAQKTSSANTRSGVVSSGVSSSGVISQAAVAPAVIASCVIMISASDMSPIQDVFNVSAGETLTKTYDIPNGDQRTFKVELYGGANGSGDLLYEGMTVADMNGGSVALDIAMVLSDIMDALEELNKGNVVGARDLFRAAVAKHSGDGTDNSDTANFFYAITRVFALWFDMQSDGANDGLNDTGDILDAFGCDPGGRDPVNLDMHIETSTDPVPPLFAGTVCSGEPLVHPSGKQLQDFAYDKVRAELIGAIANLDKVPQSFSMTWTEPFDNTVVESDYGDVHVLRAAMKAALGGLEIEDAYDLDVIINSDLDLNTLQSFFSDNPNFPFMRYTGNPVEAKTYFNEALNDAEAGIAYIESETDSQADDWINLDGDTSLQIQDKKDDIVKARDCLNGQGKCITDDNDTTDPADDDEVNFATYFEGNITNINSFLPRTDPFDLSSPPSYVDDDPVGFFHDPYFGGVLVKLEGLEELDKLNLDEDVDGNADSIDRDIYYVYGSDIDPPYDPYSYVCQKDPASCGFTKLKRVLNNQSAFQSSDGNDEVLFSHKYYYVTSYTDIPTFEDRKSQIDAFEFINTGDNCCSYGIWAWGFGWQNFWGSPDGNYVELDDRIDSFIWMESPPGTTGLKVYVHP